MPRIEQTIKDNYVAAHTFRFITPRETRAIRHPESMHVVPQGQVESMGHRAANQVDNDLALAGRAVGRIRDSLLLLRDAPFIPLQIKDLLLTVRLVS